VTRPPPFSQRHNGYLQRYVSTGEARVIDSLRQVVALRKVGVEGLAHTCTSMHAAARHRFVSLPGTAACQDRTVFPVTMVVTKLTGSGQDQVFMGVVRQAITEDPSVVRLDPSDLMLCSAACKAMPLGFVPFCGLSHGGVGTLLRRSRCGFPPLA